MEQNFLITGISRVILVGKYEYPDMVLRFRNHLDHNELIYHFSGRSTVKFNGETLFCEPDTVRFLPQGPNRYYEVIREERGDCIDIYFDTDIPLSATAFAVKVRNNSRISGLFRKLFLLWVAKNDGYYFACMSLLYKIFSELQKQTYLPENQYKALQPALDYIHEQFLSTKISVPHLAALCGISESYLKKLFVKKFGIPPIKYIIRLKINYACDLLRTRQYTVSQVAAMCGYSNVYYFSSQFKEAMGVSPLAFAGNYVSSR